MQSSLRLTVSLFLLGCSASHGLPLFPTDAGPTAMAVPGSPDDSGVPGDAGPGPSGDGAVAAVDMLSEVAVGAFGWCSRSRLGDVRCWRVVGHRSIELVIDVRGARAIAAGGDGIWSERFHACWADASGDVSCVGDRNAGPSPATDTTPRPIVGARDAVELAAGGRHACLRTARGAVACWGAGSSGQLGDGTREDSRGAVFVSRLSDARAITAGMLHTCALDADGAAWCWGENGHGQLGDGSTESRTVPARVTQLGEPAVAISAGHYHTCALLDGGQVRCWGAAASFEGLDAELPLASAISVGGWHTCVLDRSGRPACFGTPRPAAPDVQLRQLSAGEGRTCGVSGAGEIVCWPELP